MYALLATGLASVKDGDDVDAQHDQSLVSLSVQCFSSGAIPGELVCARQYAAVLLRCNAEGHTSQDTLLEVMYVDAVCTFLGSPSSLVVRMPHFICPSSCCIIIEPLFHLSLGPVMPCANVTC
eukprot:scaffold38006_cov18-Tisochrysis_lutea.AAC.3